MPVKGPWYGHDFYEPVTYPFMLTRKLDEIFWGYDEQTSEPTNIGTKAIQVGEQITVGAGPETAQNFGERSFQIVERHYII